MGDPADPEPAAVEFQSGWVAYSTRSPTARSRTAGRRRALRPASPPRGPWGGGPPRRDSARSSVRGGSRTRDRPWGPRPQYARENPSAATSACRRPDTSRTGPRARRAGARRGERLQSERVATPAGAEVDRRSAPPVPRRACVLRDRGALSIRPNRARIVTIPLRDGPFGRNLRSHSIGSKSKRARMEHLMKRTSIVAALLLSTVIAVAQSEGQRAAAEAKRGVRQQDQERIHAQVEIGRAHV